MRKCLNEKKYIVLAGASRSEKSTIALELVKKTIIIIQLKEVSIIPLSKKEKKIDKK